MQPQQEIQIKVQAAGKILSRQNAAKLTDAFRAIASVLINAGLTDAASLKQLMEDSVESAEEAADPPAAVDASTDITAASFASQVQRITWHDRLKSTLKIFTRRFADAHNLTDQEYQQEYGDNETRQQAISSIIGDLSTILTEMSRSHPGPAEAENVRDRLQGYEPPYSPFMLSAESGEEKPINKVTLAFQCEAAAEEIAAAKRGRRRTPKNRAPITGVLFRVDEPSEAIPAKGPGMPLYVPKEVAASILNTVAGLPLDAHDNLSQHADEEIAGVMLSAELRGQDFVVHGYLWPGSKSSKVRKIVANQERLGMSMMADAWGHEAEVNGQKVFWVDDIELGGANILFSDCATYRKTRLIVAENQDPGGRDPTALDATLRSQIAASTDSPDPTSTTQPEDRDMEELQKQLAALTTTVMDAVGKLQAEVAAQSAKVAAIESELRKEQEAIAAAQSQQAEEQRTAALVKTITEAVSTALQASIQPTVKDVVGAEMSRFVNPSRQPRRITTPLLAGGGGQSQQTSVSAEAMALQLQIAQLSGELKASRSMADQIRLLDEKRALEQQLLMMQPA